MKNIILSFLIIIFSYSTIQAKNIDEIVRNWKDYNREYSKLEQKCIPLAIRSNKKLMDISHCVWRKDQILLKKFDFDPLFYHHAYQRYSQIFNLAKSSTINLLNGNRDRIIENFSINIVTIEDDFQELMKQELINFLSDKK